MKSFIEYFLSTKEHGQFVPESMVQEILDRCLPIFFSGNFPIEKMTWEAVEEYQPMIYHMKREEINKEIYDYLEKNYPDAWFKLVFNLEAMDVINQSIEDEILY